MSARKSLQTLGLAALGAFLAGCATTKPFDYTNFRQHRPRSVLVLPPLNESTDVRATYGYLSTVTRPLAELGYYVFPVAMVDQFLKENGLPTAGEMHQAPLDKLAKIFGTDSVLYITVKEYGTKYHVIDSVTTVRAEGKLIDAKTGMTLWEGWGFAQQGSGNGGGSLIGMLVSAAVSQTINSTADTGHPVSRGTNYLMFTHSGFLPGSGGPPFIYGPYRPEGQVNDK